MSNIGKRLAASATREIGFLILKWNIICSGELAEVLENSLKPATYIDGGKIWVQYSRELSEICGLQKEVWLSCFSGCI